MQREFFIACPKGVLKIRGLVEDEPFNFRGLTLDLCSAKDIKTSFSARNHHNQYDPKAHVESSTPNSALHSDGTVNLPSWIARV